MRRTRRVMPARCTHTRHGRFIAIHEMRAKQAMPLARLIFHTEEREGVQRTEGGGFATTEHVPPRGTQILADGLDMIPAEGISRSRSRVHSGLFEAYSDLPVCGF